MVDPDIGAVAPDLELEGIDGQPVQLSSLWQSGPAVLVFLRHFG